MTWETLRIALVQAASTLVPSENVAALGELAAQIPPEAELIVFPEAFARDFGRAGSPLGEFAEPVSGAFGSAVASIAASRGAVVLAGMFEPSDDPAKPFNTLVAGGLDRSGPVAAYRKIHLYDSFGYRESDSLTGGPATPAIVDVAGVPTGLMTCYDLRFPELARALVTAGAELLVVPTAWVAGERKVDHWRTLVRARAIENTVYVVACGQPAPRYSGHSLIVDPLGDVLAEAGEGEETVGARLTRACLEEARSVNPSLANRRL